MINGKYVLAIIPARGGSKGLPRKNVLNFLGKPLIRWTIEQAKNSIYIDKIIVSTDDDEIKTISRVAGADVPFIRPKELATDDAKGIDVILHAVNWSENNDKERCFDIIVYLQPTSPLRLSEDIDCSIEMLFSKDAKAIVSICEVEHNPLWTNVLPPDGCMKNFIRPEVLNRNRQEFPQYYRLNGSIYISMIDLLKLQKTFYGDKTFAYIMPRERSVDIDTFIDFQVAEFLFKINQVK